METQEKSTLENGEYTPSAPLTTGTGSNRSLPTDGPLAQTLDDDDDDDDELVDGDIPDDLDADFDDDDDLLADDDEDFDDDDDVTNVHEDDLDTLDGPLRDINNPT